MADDVDRANAMAAAERAAMVKRLLADAAIPRAPRRLAADGQPICIGCGKPIPPKRLAAVPQAVACTACEAANERQAHNNRRKPTWAQ